MTNKGGTMKVKIIVLLGVLAIALGAVGAAQAKGPHSPLPTPINEY